MRIGGSSRGLCAFGLAALLLSSLGGTAAAFPATMDASAEVLQSYLPTAPPQCLPQDAWSGATPTIVTDADTRQIVQSWTVGPHQLTDVVRVESAGDGLGDMIVVKRTLKNSSGKPKILTMEARSAKHHEDAFVRMTQRSGKSLGPDHLEAWFLDGVDVEGMFEGPMPKLGEILVGNQQGKKPELSLLGGRVVAAINQHIQNKQGDTRQHAVYAARYCEGLDADACKAKLELVPDGAHHLFGRVARPFIRQLVPLYKKRQRAQKKARGSKSY